MHGRCLCLVLYKGKKSGIFGPPSKVMLFHAIPFVCVATCLTLQHTMTFPDPVSWGLSKSLAQNWCMASRVLGPVIESSAFGLQIFVWWVMWRNSQLSPLLAWFLFISHHVYPFSWFLIIFHLWLVVSNMNFIFHIRDVILPIDELIFFKMVIAPPTRSCFHPFKSVLNTLW